MVWHGRTPRLLEGNEHAPWDSKVVSAFKGLRTWQRCKIMLGQQRLSSRPEESHLRSLPEPYVNLSIHTAPDVRPLP